MADLRTLLADSPVANGASRFPARKPVFATKPKWWSAAALNARCWGCCTAMAPGRPDRLSALSRQFAPVFAALKPFIARAGLTPYNVARKRGELKYLLLTESQLDGGMMLRLCCAQTKLEQLRAALPWRRRSCRS
jgi:23S rRNA (uracil747-C5)-methyltransferase